jgi:hypothetical protein
MSKAPKILEVGSDESLRVPDPSALLPSRPADHVMAQKEHSCHVVPAYRSDLAYAAGFTALAFLFGYSIVDVIFDLGRSEAISQTTFLIALPLPRLPAHLLSGWESQPGLISNVTHSKAVSCQLLWD